MAYRGSNQASTSPRVTVRWSQCRCRVRAARVVLARNSALSGRVCGRNLRIGAAGRCRRGAGVARRLSASRYELVDVHADVPGDTAEQDRR